MEFWIYMLAMTLLTPIIMLVMGWVFIKSPPKNINSLYGYRTELSMKNQDTWDYAHKYCGRLWVRLGLVLLPLSLAAMLPFRGADTETVGIAGVIILIPQLLIMFISIPITQSALKKTFDQYGIRRL